MELGRIIVLCSILVFIRCGDVKNDFQCAEVSGRLMYSIVDDHLENIQKNIQTSNKSSKDLIVLISDLRDFNNQLVVLAGGFKSGKSLEMVDPCQKGEQVYIHIKDFRSEKKYNELVDLLVSNKLVDERKGSNMKFIINSYFCEEGCSFSDSNLKGSAVGVLLLETLVLQFTLIDMI